MGRVFVAEHIRLGRQVALKVLRSEFSGNREAVRRFFAEARAVNRINHENIIEVSDFIEDANGASFYIMELLKGMDLRAFEDQEGRLPLDRALRIALQICGGLAAAHDAGIIHRDLKPDNVFLIERGGRKDFVKLLDFGVAKLMNAALDEASTFKSAAGIVVGTPDYMSPEQALGQAVDHRTDIYSLGVILFEMVVGQRPFRAESAREIMVQHLVTQPPRPSKVMAVATSTLPDGLEELVLDCLQKEPRDRPQSVRDVEKRLRKILVDLPFAAAPTSRWRAYAKDRRVRIASAAGLLTMIVGSWLSLRSPGARSHVAAAASATGSSVPAGTLAGSSGTRLGPGANIEPIRRIEVTFTSTPPGADVFRVGATDERVGVTPFQAHLLPGPVGAEPALFEFRREGWKTERRSVSLSVDAHVDVILAADTPVADSQSAAVVGDLSPDDGQRQKKRVDKHAAIPATEPRRKPAKLDESSVLDPFE